MERSRPRTPATRAASVPTLRQRLGDRAEAAVARHLTSLGWTRLAASVRVGRDEIDLIALEPTSPPTLVFVEVRSHSTSRFGAPEESVDASKVARTYRAAFALLRDRRLPDGRPLPLLAWRVDLLTVSQPPATFADDPQAATGAITLHLRGLTLD